MNGQAKTQKELGCVRNANPPIGTGKELKRKLKRNHPNDPSLFLCTTCNDYKKWEDFHKRRDGIAYICKECSRKYCKENSDRRRAHSKKYHNENKEQDEKRRKIYYEKNKHLIREKARIHAALPEVRARINERWLIRKNTVPIAAIRHRVKCLIRYSLKRGENNGELWKSLLDFTVQELKAHIILLFTEGMTWDHYLRGEIHVDHKVPITKFDIKDYNDEEFKKCWALENLQPLWAHDNLVKGNRIDV